MNAASPPRPTIRFRNEVFRALVIAPEPPLSEWLVDLDAFLWRSPAFFAGRPVVLDAAALVSEGADLPRLVADLAARGVRVLGLRGADAVEADAALPPPLLGGRPARAAGDDRREAEAASAPNGAAASLLLDTSLRSGQSVRFPEGDVTVVGSVASGAEIVAGGSIHVYGALRGRAVAGSKRDPHARIYCRKFDPELIGINGLYNTADAVDARYRGRPIQARLDAGAIVLSALD